MLSSAVRHLRDDRIAAAACRDRPPNLARGRQTSRACASSVGVAARLTPMYPGKITTSSASRVWIACTSASRALADPRRADEVAPRRGDGPRRAREPARAAPRDGRRPRASRRARSSARPRRCCSPTRCSRTRAARSGRAYGEFMRTHGFDADERAAVTLVDGDEELAWVMTRYRQVHDLWHVLCGLPPSVLGELALKWFELVQTRLPVAGLSAVVGPLSLRSWEERRLLARVYVPGARARRPPRGCRSWACGTSGTSRCPSTSCAASRGSSRRPPCRTAAPPHRSECATCSRFMPTVFRAPCGAAIFWMKKTRCHGAEVDFPVRRRWRLNPSHGAIARSAARRGRNARVRCVCAPSPTKHALD